MSISAEKNDNFHSAELAIKSRRQKNKLLYKTPLANGELSCAAPALLVKSVRVGVSLGDLLALRLKKQRQTIKQFRAINDLKLPYQIIKTENSKTQMSYQITFAIAGEWLPLLKLKLKLKKFRAAKLPKPESWKTENPK